MEKVCEEINYAACSIFSVASTAFIALAFATDELIFIVPAGVSLFQSIAHFVAMMASRERQRENSPRTMSGAE